MGTPKRIPVDAIQAMKKILDALPDKNLDKTKEEALTMLNGHIQKAYSKGYSVKELAAILSEGTVAVSAPTLRAHTCPASSRVKKEKPTAKALPPKEKVLEKTGSPAKETIKEAEVSNRTKFPATETVKAAPSTLTPAQRAELRKLPAYYTPDLPDDEL
jgi:hypothetical protein